MNDYKLDKENSANERHLDMYSEYDFSKPSSDQVYQFQNLYKTLFSIDPQTDPQNFCANLNILIDGIEYFQKNFANLDELHNLQFFQSIVNFLDPRVELEVLSKIISLLNILLKFKGPIQTALLETDFIQQSIMLYKTIPGDLTPQLLEILTNASTIDRRITNPEAPYAEGLNRIFNEISINDIYAIFESFQNSENLDADEMNTQFSRFLYKITSFELIESIQEFILTYIGEKYSNGISDDYKWHIYHFYIFILSQMSKYEETFPIGLFYENELQKFVIDMISPENDLDEYIYPALKTLIQILQIQTEPSFKAPEIQQRTKERIFMIAFNKKSDSEIYYKNPTRVAAFILLKILLTIEFQEKKDFLIKFLLSELLGGDEYNFERLKYLVDYYDDLSFSLKSAFIDFLIPFIDYGCDILGNRFTEFLISFDNQCNKNVLSIFYDAIEIQDEKTEMLGILGIKVLIKECKNFCEGLFETVACQIINIETIEEIIDNAKDKDLRHEANILCSTLKHLPNRLFVNKENI